MITEKRRDYPEKKRRDGSIMPAYYESRFISDGQEIALYQSMRDTLYLRTDIIGADFSKDAYDRALECKSKDRYRELFEILSIDKDSRISEYTNE